MAGDVDGFYLHVDLDVLDPDVARVNAFPAPGGLRVEDITALAQVIAGFAPITGAALTAYDPAHDRDGRGSRAAIAIARAVVGAGQPSEATP
jgi:arginase